MRADPSSLPVPGSDPAEVRETADRILARAEFGDQRSLLQRAWDWVFEQLDQFVGTLLGGSGGDVFGWAVVIVLAAVAAFFAVRFTRGVRRDPASAPGVAGATRRPAEDWRADAEAQERAGDWRAALRCRYRALVADLAGAGLVEEVPGRTAGEYRRQVLTSVPDRAGDFAAATDLFEAAWYGNRPAGADEARQVAALDDVVVDQQ